MCFELERGLALLISLYEATSLFELTRRIPGKIMSCQIEGKFSRQLQIALIWFHSANCSPKSHPESHTWNCWDHFHVKGLINLDLSTMLKVRSTWPRKKRSWYEYYACLTHRGCPPYALFGQQRRDISVSWVSHMSPAGHICLLFLCHLQGARTYRR